METWWNSMKLTKSKLQEIINEMLDDYDYNNPPPAEMIADALQDGLKKLIPAYDANERMENIVHERVMEFAVELYELMEEPEISVDPERYYDWGDDLDLEEGTSPTGREETPCKGRGCVTKQRPEITDYAEDIGKEMKSGKIKKTYVDPKTGKRKETNKYALATYAAKQPGSMRGKDFARKIPKDVNPKTGAKKKKKK